MLTKLILAVLLLGIATSFDVAKLDVTWEKGLVVLDKDNFKDIIQKVPVIFVLFYNPWCGYSDDALTKFTIAADQTDSNETVFAKIDVTQNPNIAQEQKLQAYPYMKLFKNNGAEVVDFDGDMDSFDIQYFAKHKGHSQIPFITDFTKLKALNHPFVFAFCIYSEKLEFWSNYTKKMYERFTEYSFLPELSIYYFVGVNCPPNLQAHIDRRRFRFVDVIQAYINATNQNWVQELDQDIMLGEAYPNEFVKMYREKHTDMYPLGEYHDMEDFTIVHFNPPSINVYLYYHREPIVYLDHREMHEASMRVMFTHFAQVRVSLGFNNRLRNHITEQDKIVSVLMFRKRVYDELLTRETFYNATKRLDPYNSEYYHGFDRKITSKMVFVITDISDPVPRRLLHFTGKNESDLPLIVTAYFDKTERKFYKKATKAEQWILDFHLYDPATDVYHKRGDTGLEVDRRPVSPQIKTKTLEFSSFILDRMLASTSLRRCAVVEFYNTYCSHCKKVHPLVDKLSNKYSADALAFGRIQLVDDEVKHFRIKYVPVLRFYYPGYSHDYVEYKGELTEAAIEKWIKESTDPKRCRGQVDPTKKNKEDL